MVEVWTPRNSASLGAERYCHKGMNSKLRVTHSKLGMHDYNSKPLDFGFDTLDSKPKKARLEASNARFGLGPEHFKPSGEPFQTSNAPFEASDPPIWISNGPKEIHFSPSWISCRRFEHPGFEIENPRSSKRSFKCTIPSFEFTIRDAPSISTDVTQPGGFGFRAARVRDMPDSGSLRQHRGSSWWTRSVLVSDPGHT